MKTVPNSRLMITSRFLEKQIIMIVSYMKKPLYDENYQDISTSGSLWVTNSNVTPQALDYKNFLVDAANDHYSTFT